jgi:hypothetical protein
MGNDRESKLRAGAQRLRGLATPGVFVSYATAVDAVSTKRFSAASKQMQSAGFADVEQKQTALDGTFESLHKLRVSLRQLSGMLTSERRTRSKV